MSEENINIYTPRAIGLFGGIQDSPEEDTNRTVLADLLDEIDALKRAELIRLQVAQARLPSGSGEQAAMQQESAAILTEFGPLWEAEYTKLAKQMLVEKYAKQYSESHSGEQIPENERQKAVSWIELLEIRPVMRRGVYEDVSLDLRPLYDRDDVQDHKTANEFSEFILKNFESPEKRVDILRLHNQAFDGDNRGLWMPSLMANPIIKQVRVLDMKGSTAGNNGVKRLSSGEFDALEELIWHDHQFDGRKIQPHRPMIPNVVESISRSGGFKKLRRIDFGEPPNGVVIRPPQVDEVYESEFTNALQSLARGLPALESVITGDPVYDQGFKNSLNRRAASGRSKSGVDLDTW